MKTTTKLLSLVLVLLMTVACFAACGEGGTTNYAADNTEYYIGISGPLTGPAASYGLAVKNSAQLAADEINANGGINGTQIKVVMMDDVHKAENVSTNYTTMFEAGMQVALGCVTSTPCLEFKTLSHNDNLFFITPSATADAVVEYDNAYQMCFADANQGTAAAEYVNSNYAGQTIGMLYRSDDAYSTGIRAKFKAALDSSITVVEASFSGDTVASFQSQIDTLKDCKFIFMPIYAAPAAQFMDEAKNDVAADAVYYGCDGLDGLDTSVEGFDVTKIPQKISFLSHFNSKATEGASAEFIKKYTEKYGSDTLSQFGASAYDCVYALAQAMTEADKAGKISVTSSPSEICDVLKEAFQSGFTYSNPGVTGTSITWDANGFVKKAALVYVIKEAD